MFLWLCTQNRHTSIMEQARSISREQVMMAFVATCIETTARYLNTDYREVFENAESPVGFLFHAPYVHLAGKANMCAHQLILITRWYHTTTSHTKPPTMGYFESTSSVLGSKN